MRNVLFSAFLMTLFLAGCVNPPPPLKTGDARPDPSLTAPSMKGEGGFSLAEPFFPASELGKLRVGMTKAEVVALFSAPKTTKRTPKDEYWEYSWFELYFRDGRLVNWFTL